MTISLVLIWTHSVVLAPAVEALMCFLFTPHPQGHFEDHKKSHPYTNDGIVYSCYKKAIILQVVLNL